MLIDMLKRQCSGRLQQKIGEKRLGCSATRSVRQLHENSCRKGNEEKNELEEEGQVSLSFPRERIYNENDGFLPKRIIRGLLSIVGEI